MKVHTFQYFSFSIYCLLTILEKVLALNDGGWGGNHDDGENKLGETHTLTLPQLFFHASKILLASPSFRRYALLLLNFISSSFNTREIITLHFIYTLGYEIMYGNY